MRLFAGTSGFSYDEWRGSFYPEDLPASKLLAHYASRLPAVEINNTFYRLPKHEVVRGWRDQVPEDFRFAIKASRKITHFARLKACADTVGHLLTVTAELGDRLGALLFQLPPQLKKDPVLLDDFLALLPPATRAAFEFRNRSWFDDSVFDLLRKRDAALCIGDPDQGGPAPPLIATASWGYARLRAPAYSQAEIASWAERISAQGFGEAFVFFKHELLGPAYAAALASLQP
jgi:uncharacterized protein YecE (DUF72 family)